MRFFDWNAEKNAWLKKVRGVTFNDVVFHISTGNLLDVLRHNNPEKYPDQKIFVVAMDEYVYLVPFIESRDGIFLKTIIPSRKMTKQYLRKKKQ